MKKLGKTVVVEGRPLYEGYFYRQDGTEGYLVRVERHRRKHVGMYYKCEGNRVRRVGTWMLLTYLGVWSLRPITVSENDSIVVEGF